MFAVVEIAGTQVTVAPNTKIFVPRLESEIGTTIKFDKVLLKNDDKNTAVGSPFISELFYRSKSPETYQGRHSYRAEKEKTERLSSPQWASTAIHGN